MSVSYHSLDVAYASDTTPNNAKDVIAMAYGFAVCDSGTQECIGQGQRPEQILQNSEVYFNVYDTASSPETILSIEISFSNNHNPFNWPNSQWVVPRPGHPLPPPEDGKGSIGCNVIGRLWSIGPFTAIQDGSFECTIQVITEGNQQLIFQVDPRIIVEGV